MKFLFCIVSLEKSAICIIMRTVTIRKFSSLNKAQEADEREYARMSPAERVETVQFLREIWLGFGKGKRHESRKGLRRVVKVVQ